MKGAFCRHGARSGRGCRRVPRLAQDAADRGDYRRRRGDGAAARVCLGRVSVIRQTGVLSSDRAFKPVNNRFISSGYRWSIVNTGPKDMGCARPASWASSGRYSRRGGPAAPAGAWHSVHGQLREIWFQISITCSTPACCSNSAGLPRLKTEPGVD
jgi:hypothetical protein